MPSELTLSNTIEGDSVPEGIPVKRRILAFEPPHPGELLGEEVIPATGLTVTALAERLGISRRTLHGIISKRYGVTATMALRLTALVDGSPKMWLGKQQAYDLWHAQQDTAGDVAKIERVRVITSREHVASALT